ncbi:hypothetical protein QUC31_010718, partial [Theobroma cacao]
YTDVMFSRWSNSHHDQENDSLQHESKQVNELKAALAPLSGRSLKYDIDAYLRRYLEAQNRNVDKSKKMLEETRKWRLIYKLEEICWDAWLDNV